MKYTEARVRALDAAFNYLIKKGVATLQRPTPPVIGRDLLLFRKP